ncbi:MAG: beta-N-acetylhexosaminidase [Azospirillaceae bacterium]
MPALPTRTPRAVTFGCAGEVLSAAERALFREANPVGFVLFRRNCRTPEQVRLLVDAMREAVGWAAPVLIDQEGGRVQRFRPPAWPSDPAPRLIGRLAEADLDAGIEAARLHFSAIAADLIACGVDCDAVPVLDLALPSASDVIGDRAFSRDPAVVEALGRATIQAMQAMGVMPIIKHIPGHGRAQADSHKELPVVDTDLDTLRRTDFLPFRALAGIAPWAMTAHILFTAIDAKRPGTQSPAVIGGIIRGELGFDGLLVSDDLSMQALAGDVVDRAATSLEAGCDIALHCNGRLEEMAALAADVPLMDAGGMRRLTAALATRQVPRPGADSAALRTALARLLARHGIAAA